MARGIPFDTEIAEPGRVLTGIDPVSLKAGRANLVRGRLQLQLALMRQQIERWTPIEVTRSGVVYDGNHAVRSAAEMGVTVDVLVTKEECRSYGSIMDLSVTEK
jgi:hypothetical protein